MDLHEAMETDGDVGEADRLDDLDNDGARDRLARRVLLVRIMRANSELGNAASLGPKGRSESVQDPTSGRRRGEDGGG